jgi:hypothetical protein
MRPTYGSKGTGAICIGQSIPPAPPSIPCCQLGETPTLPNAAISKWHDGPSKVMKQSTSGENVKSGEWAVKISDGKIDSSTNSLTSPPESAD